MPAPLEIRIRDFQPPNPEVWAAASGVQKRDWYKIVAQEAMAKLKDRFLAGRSRYGRLLLRRMKPRSDGASGPPLTPHGISSRSITLMRSRHTQVDATIYWADDWGTILAYHAAGIPSRLGRRVRDVGGFTQDERVDIYNAALDRWKAPETKPSPTQPKSEQIAKVEPVAPTAKVITETKSGVAIADAPVRPDEPYTDLHALYLEKDAIKRRLSAAKKKDRPAIQAELDAHVAKINAAGERNAKIRAAREAQVESATPAEQAAITPDREIEPSRQAPTAVLRDADLPTFAESVKRLAADAADERRFGDNKVFIGELFDLVKRQPAYKDMNIEEFRRWLTTAHQRRLLTLSRADLVEAMDEHKVARAETHYFGTQYHFLLDETKL